jgi:hypothetical protein
LCGEGRGGQVGGDSGGGPEALEVVEEEEVVVVVLALAFDDDVGDEERGPRSCSSSSLWSFFSEVNQPTFLGKTRTARSLKGLGCTNNLGALRQKQGILVGRCSEGYRQA